TVSEHVNRKKQDLTLAKLDRFQLQHSEVVDQQTVGARPGNIMVCVRDYNTLGHLEHTLTRTNTEEKDLVVMTTRLITGPTERDLPDENLFTDYIQRLFTQVVALAEKHGKPVSMIVVPTRNEFVA